MVRQPDAVVGHPVLRKVVRPDLFAAVARADLLLAVLRLDLVNAFRLNLIQPRPQHAHALLAVLDLRFLILAAHHRVGRQMRNPHRRIRRIHALPARPRRAERIDAQVLGLDLDVHLLGLRQHRHRNRRGVHAPLRLRRRNPLHAVHARLVLQLRIHVVAFDDRRHVLQPVPNPRLRLRQHLDLPLVLLGEAHIHAEHLRHKQRCLVSAGPGAKLQDHVLLVVRVLGQQQHLQRLFHRRHLRFQQGKFLLRHRLHIRVRVGEHRLGLGDAVLDLAILAKLLNRRLHVAIRLRHLAVVLLIVDDLRVRELASKLFVPRFKLV